VIGDDVRIRPAVRDDVAAIERLIRSLADYEHLADQVVATADDLAAHLFGERAFAEVLIAESGGEAIGYALFFHSYSTFLTKPGIFLEDLFVLPEFRGRGLGRRLLEGVAAVAVERGCGRLEWAVLDWNEPAIGFYRALGADSVDGWTTYRLTGRGLERLGRSAADPRGSR
jgi:GNAT superfamily N-acetyltransferase